MSKKNKSKTELRPCIVTGQKALFHRWADYSHIIPPSPQNGGHSGGEFRGTLGIIEREDGTIHKAYPDEIRFIDGEVGRVFAESIPPEFYMKGANRE